MGLVQLVYVSLAVSEMTTDELVTLLAEIRPRNQERGLTGMLLISAGNIVQALEGPADEVDRLFASIEQDPRHTRVRTVWREPVERRVFGDWSMGFRELAGEVPDVDGFSDFLRSGSMEQVQVGGDPSVAALEAFRATTA